MHSIGLEAARGNATKQRDGSMNRLPLAASCAATLFLVGSAQAAEIGGGRMADWGLFESIDADRNGWISQQEIQVHDTEHPEARPPFADIDADLNGAISWQEWAVHGAGGSGATDEAGETGEIVGPGAAEESATDIRDSDAAPSSVAPVSGSAEQADDGRESE